MHGISITSGIQPYDMQELSDTIWFIFQFLNQRFQMDIDADINVDRDRISIP